MIQLYQAYKDALDENRHYKGGMHWKTSKGREYLFKTTDGFGNGKSLGVRSGDTEAAYHSFHVGKQRSKERLLDLESEIKRQAKFCVAAEINRLPNVSANILRLLDKEGCGDAIKVIGTNCLYAYEATAGVHIINDLLATGDLDLLWMSRSKLKLSTSLKSSGLIGLLKKADKTFEIASKAHFRAINSKGFMVEWVKTPSINRLHDDNNQCCVDHPENDLSAFEVDGQWLQNAPVLSQTVIAENGFPVIMNVPDPRYFAINKYYVSRDKNRDPIKAPRDKAHADIAWEIATEYLNLKVGSNLFKTFPKSLVDDF